jgi:hypothetical protein
MERFSDPGDLMIDLNASLNPTCLARGTTDLPAFILANEIY